MSIKPFLSLSLSFSPSRCLGQKRWCWWPVLPDGGWPWRSWCWPPSRLRAMEHTCCGCWRGEVSFVFSAENHLVEPSQNNEANDQVARRDTRGSWSARFSQISSGFIDSEEALFGLALSLFVSFCFTNSILRDGESYPHMDPNFLL